MAQSSSFTAAALRQSRNEQQSVLTLSHYPSLQFVDSLTTTATKPKRSVGKALLFSAAIPGTGQFYNKSFLKGLAFAGIEIGAWAVNLVYTSRGNEKTETFQNYADAHWSEEKYWSSLAVDAKERHGLTIDVNDRQGLKEYERAYFSHFLPDTRNQTYYENIGKYSQFNAGWDDSISGKANQHDSERRELYTFMRKDANDQFKIATYGASAVLINHLASMLDAAYSTYRFNHNQAKASMGIRMQRYNDELAPALCVNVEW